MDTTRYTEIPPSTGIDCKRRLLLAEANRWLGVQEQGGNNQGQVISMFQAWDDKADHVAWCMAFVQYCLKQTDHLYAQLMDMESKTFCHCLFPTEHVLTAWERTPQTQRRQNPEPGLIAIWQHYRNGKPTTAGHTGIVVEVPNATTFFTLEGNTSLSTGSTGEGVARKRRSFPGTGRMQLCGFLDPWIAE